MTSATDNPTAQRNALLPLLRASREAFLSSFAGISENEAYVRPGQDRWSILDCVEHICASETRLFSLLSGPRRPRQDGAPNREELFLAVAANRGRKLESPETGRPNGRFATLAEARARFEAVRASVISFVEQNQEDLRATEVTHPHAVAGDVSAYELVILIARHAERHIAQIDEIKGHMALHANPAAIR